MPGKSEHQTKRGGDRRFKEEMNARRFSEKRAAGSFLNS
jgi:hypothetical protein